MLQHGTAPRAEQSRAEISSSQTDKQKQEKKKKTEEDEILISLLLPALLETRSGLLFLHGAEDRATFCYTSSKKWLLLWGRRKMKNPFFMYLRRLPPPFHVLSSAKNSFYSFLLLPTFQPPGGWVGQSIPPIFFLLSSLICGCSEREGGGRSTNSPSSSLCICFPAPAVIPLFVTVPVSH